MSIKMQLYVDPVICRYMSMSFTLILSIENTIVITYQNSDSHNRASPD